MKFGIPQIIYIVLIGYNLLNSLTRHGETKKPGKYNFFIEAISTVITVAILNWGGFFG